MSKHHPILLLLKVMPTLGASVLRFQSSSEYLSLPKNDSI